MFWVPTAVSVKFLLDVPAFHGLREEEPQTGYPILITGVPHIDDAMLMER